MKRCAKCGIEKTPPIYKTDDLLPLCKKCDAPVCPFCHNPMFINRNYVGWCFTCMISYRVGQDNETPKSNYDWAKTLNMSVV